jgi:hypothetical protein
LSAKASYQRPASLARPWLVRRRPGGRGILTEFGWRLVFFVPVLVSLAVLLAGIRLIPEDDQLARTDGFGVCCQS